MNKSWYVYIVKCNDNTLYTGITTDIKSRIETHNKGKGAKYCRGKKLPVKLLWSIECKGDFGIGAHLHNASKVEAAKLEYKIKQMSREQKLEMISLYNSQII